jgi:ATP-dependent exoDNAse (exonuclease V) alpha subunit
MWVYFNIPFNFIKPLHNTFTPGTCQILKPDYKNLRHGYTSTSYSSQGLTVKQLIVAQAEVSLPATSFEQAYVSLSRGKTSVSLYTDNKQSLEKAMSVSKSREIVVGLNIPRF